MNASEIAIDAIQNPSAALKAAMGLALRSGLAPDDVGIIRRILQPWWDNETDARALCRYLGALGAAEGQGSVAHRRAVRVAVLCARTALSNVREQDRDETAQILDTIEAWACGKAPEADLQTLRDRVQMLWSAAADVAADVANAAAAGAAAGAAANAASYATSFYAAAAADTAAYAAHVAAHAAHAVGPTDTPDWFEARDRHLAYLADMICVEIPVCPVRLP